jgi:23S rRNA (adenine2503-C2)-methyltransferase
MPRPIHDLNFAALEGELAAAGLRPAHARALWRALHRDGAEDLAAREDFLPPLRRWIGARIGRDEGFSATLPPVYSETASSDGLTRKFLLSLADGQTVETVLMGYPGRYTACLSTQVGCAMGCVFCATGQMGFVRHLSAGEIVAQVLHCRRAPLAAVSGGLRNLVLMGMGEPLHNYDAVMAALDIITDRRGINIGPARITISTVGVVPGILRMALEQRPYGLAVSLHGASEEERSALVPVSRRWPLAELIAACREYTCRTARRIFFEWTLIAGRNDSPSTAARLAALLQGIDAHINLIPLNPTGNYSGIAASSEAVHAFQRVLRDAGFPVTIRQRRGIDVAAGCGQLRSLVAMVGDPCGGRPNGPIGPISPIFHRPPPGINPPFPRPTLVTLDFPKHVPSPVRLHPPLLPRRLHPSL